MKKIETKQSMHIEVDMLEGNINRMCVTDDYNELVKNYIVAMGRLQSLLDYLIPLIEMEI